MLCVRVRATGNSGTECRELDGDGTGRNCTEFQELLPIPEFHPILEFLEFDGTRSVTGRYVILNDERVPGIGWDWFRVRN